MDIETRTAGTQVANLAAADVQVGVDEIVGHFLRELVAAREPDLVFLRLLFQPHCAALEIRREPSDDLLLPGELRVAGKRADGGAVAARERRLQRELPPAHRDVNHPRMRRKEPRDGLFTLVLLVVGWRSPR